MRPRPGFVGRRGFLLTAAGALGACASARTPKPPHYPDTNPQPRATGDKAPHPPISPEADPENVERRFGFEEARQRKEATRKRQAAARESKKRVEPVDPNPQQAPPDAVPKAVLPAREP